MKKITLVSLLMSFTVYINAQVIHEHTYDSASVWNT